MRQLTLEYARHDNCTPCVCVCLRTCTPMTSACVILLIVWWLVLLGCVLPPSSLPPSLPLLSPLPPSLSSPPYSPLPLSYRVKLAQPLRPWMEPRITRAVSSPSNGLLAAAIKDDSFVPLPSMLVPPSSHTSVKRTQTMPSRSRDSSPLVLPRPDRRGEESKYL